MKTEPRRLAARYPGRCRCGAAVAAGAMIGYADRRIVDCPACRGGAAAGEAAAPASVPAGPTAQEASAALSRVLARLDADQARVAAWRPADGNLRVVAAAGSGKTTTVVALVARLVRDGVAPARIVATTFTNRAGRELGDRLAALLPPGAIDAMRVGTFHSLALRSLREADPQRWSLDRCLDAREGTRRAGIPSSSILWSRIVGWGEIPGLPRDRGLDLDEADPAAYCMAVDLIRSAGLDRTTEEGTIEIARAEREKGLPGLGQAWALADQAKASLGAFDFADALEAYHRGLATGAIRDGADVVIVDEAQDNSRVQIEIARLLARGGRLILVGDGRQAIYSWRGAHPEMFLRADEEIDAVTLEIRNNYRSGRGIVAVGNGVARGKPWSVGDDARAARDLDGDVAIEGGHADPQEEALAIADRIEAGIASGERSDGYAVLTRTNAQAGPLEAALVERRIPVVVVGGTPFFARREVRDLLGYCRLAEADDMEALGRVVNRPKRFLGRAFVASVEREVGAGAPLIETIERIGVGLRRGARDGAAGLGRLVRSLREAGWPRAAEVAAEALAPEEGVDRRENGSDSDRVGLVWTAAALARRFGSASDLIGFADRCAGEVQAVREEEDRPTGRVTISTVHRAKGLEWSRLFVCASAGVFPHARSAGDAGREAEEERLFYVACTRARDALTLTWARENLRGKPAGPSPFLAVYVEPCLPARPAIPPVVTSGGKDKSLDPELTALMAAEERRGMEAAPARAEARSGAGPDVGPRVILKTGRIEVVRRARMVVVGDGEDGQDG